METIQITVFATSADSVTDMVEYWQAHMQDIQDLDLQFTIIDILEHPEEAERYDVIFSPTTRVLLPQGEEFRLTGYNNVLPSLIRALYVRRAALAQSSETGAIFETAKSMSSDVIKMRQLLQTSQRKVKMFTSRRQENWSQDQGTD